MNEIDVGMHAEAAPIEREIARLIVDALQLEIAPEAIAPDEALFGDGLGLDSIDALEIALAVSRRYGISLRSDGERNAAIFASLRALARFVAEQRGSTPTAHP